MISLTNIPMQVYASDVEVDDWITLDTKMCRVTEIDIMEEDSPMNLASVILTVCPTDLCSGRIESVEPHILTAADLVNVYNERY